MSLFGTKTPFSHSGPATRGLTTVATFEDPAEADDCLSTLNRHGIVANLRTITTGNSGWFGATNVLGIELQVAAVDAHRAKRIVEASHPTPQPTRRNGNSDKREITFECVECGGKIVVSARRRGGVETCPHCREYVDVPN